MKYLLYCLVLMALPLVAVAQQPSPQDQLAQAQAMVSTLYRQLNTAIQDGAAQEALRVKLQGELERLHKDLLEAKEQLKKLEALPVEEKGHK